MTLLKDLLSSKEHSAFLLLEDTLERTARPLIKHLIAEAAKENTVLVLNIDTPHEDLLLSSRVDARRVKVFDAFEDPYGWAGPTIATRRAGQVSDLQLDVTPITYLDDLSRVFETLQTAITNVTRTTKTCTVVIDSLEPFLKTALGYAQLKRLTNLLANSGKFVGVYHGDLPVPEKPKAEKYCTPQLQHPHASLSYLATTHVQVRHMKRLDEVISSVTSGARRISWPSEDAFDYVDLDANNDDGGVCAIEHRRRSGKVAREIGGFQVNVDGTLAFRSDGDLRSQSLRGETKRGAETVDESGDPTANLSFNLTLTDDQKTAKSKVALPYMKAQELVPGSGTIFYAPDAADDFDEDDPDDDLNI